MGILSLVLAAIFSTWTAILRASKVGNEAAAAVQRTRIAVRTLEESLGSAQAFAEGVMPWTGTEAGSSQPGGISVSPVPWKMMIGRIWSGCRLFELREGPVKTWDFLSRIRRSSRPVSVWQAHPHCETSCEIWRIRWRLPASSGRR